MNEACLNGEFDIHTLPYKEIVGKNFSCDSRTEPYRGCTKILFALEYHVYSEDLLPFIESIISVATYYYQRNIWSIFKGYKLTYEHSSSEVELPYKTVKTLTC